MNRDRPILILKTGDALPDVKARYGDFDTWMAEGLGCDNQSLLIAEVHQGDPLPKKASELAGVIVTGSPEMVSDRADWSEASAHWLSDVVRRDALPVLGVCYGHQLLAHGLGGRVASNPKGREIGTWPLRITGESEELGPLFKSGTFPTHLSHVESVVEPPTGARVLGTTALEPNCILAFGPRQWGVQFHPEFDVPIMRGYLESRRAILTEEGQDVDAMIKGVESTTEATRTLTRFAAFVAAELDSDRVDGE